MGIREDFARSWDNFFTSFCNGIKKVENKPDSKAKVIAISYETLDTLRELQDNLEAYKGSWMRRHITSRSYSKTMNEWINYIGKLIEQLGSQMAHAEGKKEKKNIKKLTDKFWNGLGGINNRLSDSLNSLEKILSYWSSGTPAVGIMSHKLRDYLKSLRNSQNEFITACENVIVTAKDPEDFKSNFENIIKKDNIIDLLAAQNKFLNLVQSFDRVVNSEKRKQIPKLEKTYEEEFAAFYTQISELGKKYKKDIEFINHVDLKALRTEAIRTIKREK